MFPTRNGTRHQVINVARASQIRREAGLEWITPRGVLEEWSEVVETGVPLQDGYATASSSPSRSTTASSASSPTIAGFDKSEPSG